MVFDTDIDLTKDFREIVSGKKKQTKTKDFEFGGLPVQNGVIRQGTKAIRGKRGRGRPVKDVKFRVKSNVIRKGVQTIKKSRREVNL